MFIVRICAKKCKSSLICLRGTGIINYCMFWILAVVGGRIFWSGDWGGSIIWWPRISALSVLRSMRRGGMNSISPISCVRQCRISPSRIYILRSITVTMIWFQLSSVSTTCSAPKKASKPASTPSSPTYSSTVSLSPPSPTATQY